MEQKQKLEPKSIYDYTKILEEIPDYDEVRGIFLACQIPEWEIVKEEVTNEVIATGLYQFQTTSDKKAMLQFVLAGAKRNHGIYLKALEICKRAGLDCCRMVEYIGNYPTSYPTPEESEKSVVSTMIWGSQYDAMMNWMQGQGEDIMTARIFSSHVTGANSEDVIRNVFDLNACHSEWTLEAYSTVYRAVRGGYSNGSNPPGYRNGFSPDIVSSSYSARLTLYIK